MLNAKKIIAALAIGLMATTVGATPTEKVIGNLSSTQVGGGWCC